MFWQCLIFWGYFGGIILLNSKAKFLLSKKYLNIKDIKEVFKAHGLEQCRDTIFDWLDEQSDIYIKARDWCNNIGKYGYICNDDGQIYPLSDIIDDGFLHLDNIIKNDYSTNNTHYEIALSFYVEDIFINEHSHSLACRDNPPNGVSKNIDSFHDFETTFYTKTSLIQTYINDNNLSQDIAKEDDITKKPIQTIEDDNYIYSEALKPYNDIIFAFESEYNEYKEKTKAETIDKWLETNYEKLSRDEYRTLKKLIQSHYKLKK